MRKAICLAAAAAPLWAGAAAAKAAAPASEPTWTYRVAKGDNLYTVARTYLAPGTGWQRLQRLNRVADPKRLAPGRELRLPVAWLRAQATVATVAFVQGTAQREAAGRPAAPLAVGDTLNPGDLLATGEGASLTLRLADGSRVLVSADSRVRLESLLAFGQSGVIQTRVGIEKGEADSRINPEHSPGTRYDIRTPALTLGVRGTEFRVRVGENSAAEVTEGRVAAAPVARGAEKALDAGFGTVADARGGPLTVQALPAAPGLTTLPTHYERVPLRFSWPAQPEAVAYRAQVFAEGAPDQRLLDGLFESPGAQWADLPDGRYLLQVRARNAKGLEGLDGRLAFTLKARPEPPFTASPRDGGRAYGTSVEFSWTGVAAAQRYRLQVAPDARFETLLVDRADLDSPKLDVPLAPGRYHWRLASIAAGDDLGPFSDAASFELREIPPPPPLEPPKAQGDTLVFRWRARSGDDAYDVQVAHDPTFAKLLLEKRENLPELLLPRPSWGTYYLRVRTIEADGFVGPWGAAQQFKVSPSLWWWLVPGAALLLAL